MSWPMVKLKDCCEVVGGATPKRNVAFYWDGDIPWITPKDVSNLSEPHIYEAPEYISKAGYKSAATYMLPVGTVLLTSRAPIGNVAIAGIELCTNQGFKSLIPGQNVHSKYLYHCIKKFVPQLELLGNGATFKEVSKRVVEDFEIPLPPLEEQKRIAAILDKADGVRQKREQAIKLADDFLRATFLEMFGDPVSNPKGWKVKPLKELSVKIASGSTPKGGSKVYVDKGITFFRSQNVWKNDIRLDDVAYIDEKTHNSLKKSSLKHKDILMTKTGRFNTENSSLGRAALFLGDDDSANVNGHVYLIRLKAGVLHEFIVYILTSNEYREHIREVCVGGIDKRQLNKEHIEDFPIICPPDDLQIEFMRKLNGIQKIRSNAMMGLKEVIPLFNTLNQKAFSDGF
ncbi:restriction endonuclease subunit S [Salmonella enterica]|nr:restriction endonuclease subunit S [Salmonella enterica]